MFPYTLTGGVGGRGKLEAMKPRKPLARTSFYFRIKLRFTEDLASQTPLSLVIFLIRKSLGTQEIPLMGDLLNAPVAISIYRQSESCLVHREYRFGLRLSRSVLPDTGQLVYNSISVCLNKYFRVSKTTPLVGI